MFAKGNSWNYFWEFQQTETQAVTIQLFSDVATLLWSGLPSWFAAEA